MSAGLPPNARESQAGISAHGFDATFVISHTFGKYLKIIFRVFTDSRTLFDSIVSLCTITEKRLLIDICLREEYWNGDLAKLGWICTQHNISDALTKGKKNSSLHLILRTHRLKTPFQPRIDQGPIPYHDWFFTQILVLFLCHDLQRKHLDNSRILSEGILPNIQLNHVILLIPEESKFKILLGH